MDRKTPERGDDENGSFGFSDAASESIKPGLQYDDAKDRATEAGHAHGAEGHHRLGPRERKDIPNEPLAKRVREAAKGN